MKKILFLWTCENHVLTKTLRIMRIFIFLMLVGAFQVCANSSFSQTTKVSLNLQEKSIEEVLDEIEAKSEFFFLYNQRLVDVNRKIAIKVKNKPINEVLDIIFQEQDVEYRVVDKKIILSPGFLSDKETKQEDITITGTVVDEMGESLPGVSIVIKGTATGCTTNLDGKFSLKVPTDAVIVVSFIGMRTQELAIKDRTVFNIKMSSEIEGLDEVVVVGYGVQQKAHLTASVSQVDSEVVEDRAVANAAQALQGAVPNLVVSNTSYGGEPGAEMNLNIRGILTIDESGNVSEAQPLLLVDGVEMTMNDVDPEDIENVSVLKDASAAAIYGARAAGGVILITTKSGKNVDRGMKIAYSNNFSWAQPTAWPNQASAIDFAYALNDASTNNGKNPYYTEEELGWIMQNMEEPGSAPTLQVKADGKNWDQSNVGLGATGSTNWKDFFFKDWAARQKHNLRFSGGNNKLNYYASAGFYDENGLNAQAEDSYKRYNFDVKLNAKPYDWLSFALLTKFIKSDERHPWDYRYGRGRVFDLLSKVKPTLPTVDPIFNEPLVQAYYPLWSTQWEDYEKNQMMLLPRVVIEPVKDWLINLEYNYKRNNNKRNYTALTYEYHLADGSVASAPSSTETQVRPTLYTNEYFSPNIYTSYSKSIKDHNFKVLAGYQSEKTEYYNLSAKATSLLTDNIPSISTSVGEQTISDQIGHYSTQSIFSRFNYDYKGKYLFEFSYRRDGSSKFEDGSRWAGFPSYSVGYNIAREEFWPLKDYIHTFKVRGSYGTLGNQNVENYKYLSVMDIKTGTFLFDGEWDYYVNPPDLLSSSLTWERVKTTDFGLDVLAFDGKLSFNFDWYRSDISGMSTTGETLPAVLGTDEPKQNAGTMRTQGWESEIAWKQKLGDFNFNVRFVLSDYKREVVKYPNPTKLISDYYVGKNMGEIWGLEWDGWFQTQDEVDNHQIDQSGVVGWAYSPGDTKYVDQNGDKKINTGTNTVDNPGDRKVIGNTTPRYQYGLTLGAEWKGVDFSAFIQGVGKRDFYMGGTAYRGPANGPYHANVMEYNLDYWRDDSSALGANPDAHWARPYAANPGRNNKNYKYAVDRYVEDASYMRLKSIQIGYTFPKQLTKKVRLDRIRIFVTGENLWTKTDFPMYDPESIKGNFGNAVAYPLSKVLSAGINVSL
ncbi:SusC/RagA family TonB-linked outer membrane protein [Puteibacter caeruleilacunae]|nr:SusC/RagA family TonB-linked outer membrane protein [Puteibacter caeruleilacunae]